VIEAAGVQATLDSATRLVREGGRLVIAGYHQDGRREVDLGAWNWRGLDVVNAHERDRVVVLDAMREAARLAAAGRLDVERLVTHRFPLSRLADAFEAARTRPAGFVKAVVEP
jgi:threonine dehydrogenase-like Zn-dependent dehydrogenase